MPARDEPVGGLSPAAAATYTLIVKSGSVPVDTALSGVEELAELGLLQLSLEGDRYVAMDPRLVELELTSQWRQQARLLQLRAAILERDATALTADYVSARGEERDSVRYVKGLSMIGQYIDDLSRSAESEILTAQPGGGRSAEVLEAALPLALDQLGRGVELRTLYQHSARFNEPTKSYVREVTMRGGQVRTLDEFFERLFIIDRKTAILPANTDRTEAVIITDEAVVHFLADVFERNWQRALEFTPSRAALSSSEVVPDIHAMIKRLLKEGLTDSAIAKRIGVSERTYHTHLSRIRTTLGAESRVQLGYMLAQEEHRAASSDTPPASSDTPPAGAGGTPDQLGQAGG
jgi:sugar-specific transcriptional regulator TrmB